ncbi:hypothetical protein [Kytococcus sp. Marseille-QA3725]
MRPFAQRLLALPAACLRGTVLFGGTVPEAVRDHLLDAGATIFPPLHDAPVAPYRGSTYAPTELYAGLEAGGYAGTSDGRAHAWFRNERLEADPYASLLRAIHDDSVVDALVDELEGHSVVGVMGGHSPDRGGEGYAAAARLGHALVGAGHLVLTGGGPGATEAADLGALGSGREMGDVLHLVDDVDQVAALLGSA